MILTIHYQLVKLLRVGLKIFMLLLTLIEANLLHGTTWIQKLESCKLVGNNLAITGTTSVHQEPWQLAGIRKVALGII